MTESEIEKENIALRKEVEDKDKLLQEAYRRNDALATELKKHAGSEENHTNAALLKRTLAFHNLIKYVQGINILINQQQMVLAELQGQQVAVLRSTQPFFNQDEQTIIDHINAAAQASNLQQQQQPKK